MIRPLLKHLMVAALLAAPAVAQEVTSAPGAVLRALDKTSGDAMDIEMAVGQVARLGNLDIVLSDCRFPAGNPAGDAYASLEVSERGKAMTIFRGWMIASSPALSALEHQRYDLWVIRCTTS